MPRAWMPCAVVALAILIASESSADRDGCGSILTSQDVAAIASRARIAAPSGPRVAGGLEWWHVPVTMHVVRRSNGNGGLSESRLAAALGDINVPFALAGMLFYRSGPTRYIDSDDLYFNIDTRAEIDALRLTDVVAGTVNLYYTENLADEFGPLCGISSFTSSPVQGIVMKNGCTGLSADPASGPHQMGHYFDLYHTHETMFGAECVRRNPCSPVPPFPPGCFPNCTVAGDLLCDTPADPGLSAGNVNPSCVYTGTETDGQSCGDLHYVPQTWNLMSNAPAGCRNGFTVEQAFRTLATLGVRVELDAVNGACTGSTFVNLAFPNGGTGTPFFPFETFLDGVQAVPDGGCLILGPGSYAGGLTLNRPMTLQSPRGVARIGS